MREVAVISVLGNHGVAPEQALLFFVGFGPVLAMGCPGRSIRSCPHGALPRGG
jgi:hypothetical protein